jgi:hypothetical protein
VIPDLLNSGYNLQYPFLFAKGEELMKSNQPAGQTTRDRVRQRERNILLLAILALLLSSETIPATESIKPQTLELNAGELTLLLGNEYDHGAARTGYIGIWRLTSVHEPTNVFVPQYAGWIHRRNRATVTQLSSNEAVIEHIGGEDESVSHQTFRVVAPYYFDCTYSAEAEGKPLLFNGTSYINGASDPGVYFLDSEMRWQRHYDPVHGTAASLLPEGMPVPEVVKIADSRYPSGAAHFRDSFSKLRYHPDYALFYGRFRDQVLVHMFPPGSQVIPYISPSGGGFQADGRRRNPAWDWRVLITEGVEQGKAVSFTMRAIYKKYNGDADILEEYQRWVGERTAK